MEIPREVAELGERLEQWRSQRPGKRLPEELWTEAARLGHQHGFSRVARTLRLNASVLRSKIARPPAFVEFSLPMAVGECAIELSTARGKMRLELRAMPVAAIAELARALSA